MYVTAFCCRYVMNILRTQADIGNPGRDTEQDM